MPRREKIAFVGTGGTVSMTFNENQNGFIPTLSAGDLAGMLPPGLRNDLDVIDWSHQPSSHYTIPVSYTHLKKENGKAGVRSPA